MQNVISNITSEEYVNTKADEIITTTYTNDVDTHIHSLPITVSDMQSKTKNCNDHDKSWIVNLLYVAIYRLLIIQRCQF